MDLLASSLCSSVNSEAGLGWESTTINIVDHNIIAPVCDVGSNVSHAINAIV